MKDIKCKHDVNIGDSFNRYIVIGEPYRVGSRWYVKCQCSCENHTIKDVRLDNLISGHIKSCGCLAKENALIQGKKKHKVNKY